MKERIVTVEVVLHVNVTLTAGMKDGRALDIIDESDRIFGDDRIKGNEFIHARVL